MIEAEEKLFNKLPLAWLDEEDSKTKFELMCQLSNEDKQKLFSACVAKTLNPQLDNDAYAANSFELIGARLGVKVFERFRPTATNYFKHISKPQLLEQGGEILGSKWLNKNLKKTKAELVNILDRIFRTPTHHKLADDVLEKVKTWLPKHMGF